MKKITFLILLATGVFGYKIDYATNLIDAPGIGEIKEHCTVCHPSIFIRANPGDREYWKRKVKAMQEAYGLWKLEPNVEKKILDYLSTHYNKKRVEVDDE
ncbi:MAG: cytochrome C [Epsilonproteobacteria bacterium]|nr:cytochrome C [Campylobacterota bacterium]